MKTNIKRLAMGILGAILTVCVMPVSAAVQSHPRIVQFQMGEQRDIRLYFASNLEDALFGRVVISRNPGPEELERVMDRKNLVAQVTTGDSGAASCNFTELGLADGVYLVAGDGILPFYICVPAPEGDGWAYTVEVAPGYQIGGEAEPMPQNRSLAELSVEAEATEQGELGGILLVMAACCAFFLRMMRAGIW